MAPDNATIMSRGLFCVFEGIDGSGKTTLMRGLRDELIVSSIETIFGNRFRSFLMLREPTDAATGRRIRAHLQHGDTLSRVEWLELFAADRTMNVRNCIKPELDKNKLLLQDRYFYSTAAYQGDLEQEPTPQTIVKESLALEFPEPDLLFFLEIAPEAALQRIIQRGEKEESFEKLDFLKKTYGHYQKILPDHTIRLDADLPPEQLVEICLQTIKQKIS